MIVLRNLRIREQWVNAKYHSCLLHGMLWLIRNAIQNILSNHVSDVRCCTLLCHVCEVKVVAGADRYSAWFDT